MATSYTYYHAGPLFTLADLHTNSLLANGIKNLSGGKFIPVVPQDLEQRDTSSHSIRDQDIRGLLSCDLALFTYDGVELDSGTVVEYMIAKFADIPTVILRTDFRKSGDQDSHHGQEAPDPWNLMSSFWPRTKKVVVNAMLGYKAALARSLDQRNVPAEDVQNITSFDAGGGPVALKAGELLLEEIAREIVTAMEEVIKIPSVMPKEARQHVYGWIGLMPNFKRGQPQEEVGAMLELLKGKEQKGLM